MWKKLALGIAAAGGLLLATAPAHAGGHVSLSVGVGLPAVGIGGYYAPSAPAYYGPPVAYAAPPVVYAPPAYPAYGPAYRPVYGPGYVPPYYHRRYGPPVAYRPAPIGYGVRPVYGPPRDPYWR